MMERTPTPSLDAQVNTVQSEPICLICNEKMFMDQECYIISECQLSFHKTCLETLTEFSECPTCKRSCNLSDFRRIQPLERNSVVPRGKPRGALAKHYNTRSTAKNLFPDRSQITANDSHSEAANYSEIVDVATEDRPSFQNANVNISLPNNRNRKTGRNQNTTNPTIDYSQIAQLIETSMTRLLSSLNLLPNQSQPVDNNPSERNEPSTYPVFNPQIALPPINNRQPPRHSQDTTHNSSFDESTIMRFDKITSIIRNWNITFDGSPNGISVDEFLYRVKTLTHEHFNDDFSLICKNLNILLSGKARAWYWRYHKQVDIIDWDKFCMDLKYQYKDFKSNYDLKEEIRNRKMKPHETFESFYESVASLLDKLETPISETELIEILTRNLRPEIRHELLFVPIFSIAHLRKLVQMRECLLNEEQFRKGAMSKTTPTSGMRRQVAELDLPSQSANLGITDISPKGLSIDAIQQTTRTLLCWNCDEPGHRWDDCLATKTVFCYGCGSKNTYKPQCSTCLANKSSKSKN